MKMNGSMETELWRAGLRRPLTPGERAQWETHATLNPADRERIEEEFELNQLLQQLPDAPMSSNFVAQVRRRVELEALASARVARRKEPRGWFTLSWVRGLALGSALILAGLLSYQQYQIAARREVARSVARFSMIAAPTLEVIGDFKAIEGLRKVAMAAPGDDAALLEALK